MDLKVENQRFVVHMKKYLGIIIAKSLKVKLEDQLDFVDLDQQYPSLWVEENPQLLGIGLGWPDLFIKNL